MLKATKDLIKLVERQATHDQAWVIAQQLIQQGADVTALTNNGPMIHSVIAEKQRYEQTMPSKAKNGQLMIQVLENAASAYLAAQVYSMNEPDFNLLKFLVDLKASCYQIEQYGPLGLLGAYLKQNQYPIRFDIVQFLITNDIRAKRSLTMADFQQDTCLSLAKQNSNCPQIVIDYLQDQFDRILNQAPFEQPPVDPNEVILWIRRGANSEAVDASRNTVLTNAVIANNLPLVRALVSAGSNTSHCNAQNLTPVQLAKNAIPKNPALITILEAQSVNADLKRLIETKKASLAIDDIQTLLDDGANIHMTLPNNNSFLHLLVANQGSPDTISALINDLNVDLSILNVDGYRAVELCILMDDEPFSRLVAFLHSLKMTPDLFMNPRSKTSLVKFAIEQNRTGAVKVITNELNLRLWKIIVSMKHDEENQQKNLKAITQLIMLGAEVDCPCQMPEHEYQNWTILHLACKASNRLFVEYLIKNLNANYRLQNNAGDYPISVATKYGQLSIVDYLSKLSYANLNVCNYEQETPLHLASKHCQLLIARYLVSWGADHQARNASGQTALDIARSNISKNKEEVINNKKLVNFLEQLLESSEEVSITDSITSKKYADDSETCEFVIAPDVSPIYVNPADAEASFVRWNKGIFTVNPNKNLHDAARTGAVHVAKQAIGQGADIRPQRNYRAPYEVAISSMNEYIQKLNSSSIIFDNPSDLKRMIQGCQEIASMIENIAYRKILEAIEQVNASLCVIYHLAGAPITLDLLYATCKTSDNVEIVDYLISRNNDVYQMMINNTSSQSPYQVAKNNKFLKVAAYLKYRLSIDCIQAINNNDLISVKKLVKAGASVDMENTNSLNQAIHHQNPELIEFICKHGAKIPNTWLHAEGIALDESITKNWKPEVVRSIHLSLLNRRLRFSAASGDLTQLIRCHKLGADINSTNCHGSTALLCSIQHGDYFSIVHALISRGASMLHTNEMEPISLIELAKSRNYNRIAEYLSKELNLQFLAAIMNNDQQSAEKFAQLGADFNYQDDQQRTPLHYAVQYYNVDLVTWLCECGSTPTICDINGDYPIIQATEKGDYAIVAFFVTQYPATKRQVNKNGLTALQIAKILKFNRIAQLIETGTALSDEANDKQTKDEKLKHSHEKLRGASRNGHIKLIKEFIDQRYESKDEKKLLCEELIKIAKLAKQYQILDILEPYYSKTWQHALPSDMEATGNITLQESHKRILLGLLSGLSSLILDSPILIDPDNPNTYKDMFSSLIRKSETRSEELRKINNDSDMRRLNESDTNDAHERLLKINNQMEQLIESRNSLQMRVEDAEDRIFKQEKISALQRKQFIEERETMKRQLAAYECSIFLYQQQQEATLIRQHTIDFIKDNSNLALFYRTVENRLEALFHSALAAQGGYLTTKLNTATNSSFKKHGIIKLPTAAIKVVLNPILSKLDQYKQKKEWHHMSALGNIEGLGRIASDTAGLLTLYYREQIQLVDPMQKIASKVDEIAIVTVAEYITEWVIEALKRGESDTGLSESVPKQLWLYVAKMNPIHQGSTSKSSNASDSSIGKEKIPLKIINTKGEQIKHSIQLRYLIGGVSLIDGDGHIYRYQLSNESSNMTNHDLDIIGYVYLKPFSSDDKTVQLIINGRQLVHAKDDYDGNLQRRFEDITKHAQTYIQSNDQNVNDFGINKHAAKEIAEVLCEQKIFIEPKEFQEKLSSVQESIELTVDILREELREQATFYRTSIDAAHEQLQEESRKNRETMKKDNEQHYDETCKRLNDQLENAEKNLQQTIEQHMANIEEKIERRIQETLNNAERANVQSCQALAQAEKANQLSEISEKKAAQAVRYADDLSKQTKKQRGEFDVMVNKCETIMKQTVTKQKESCEDVLEETRVKVEKALQQAAIATEKSTKRVEEIEQTVKKQMEIQQKASEKIFADARESQRQVKQLIDTQLASITKVNHMCDKLEKALERIDQLAKNLESK